MRYLKFLIHAAETGANMPPWHWCIIIRHSVIGLLVLSCLLTCTRNFAKVLLQAFTEKHFIRYLNHYNCFSRRFHLVVVKQNIFGKSNLEKDISKSFISLWVNIPCTDNRDQYFVKFDWVPILCFTNFVSREFNLPRFIAK